MGLFESWGTSESFLLSITLALKWMLRKGIFFLSLQTHANLACHKAKSVMINVLVKTFLHIIWKTLDTQNNKNLWILELEKLRRSVLPSSILTEIPAAELRTVGHPLLPAGLAAMTALLHGEACSMLALQEQSYSQTWAETGFLIMFFCWSYVGWPSKVPWNTPNFSP